MKLSVFSEYYPLKHVLVHEPGLEIDEMPPSLMEHLLFDDVLYGSKARQEHRYFCNVMRMLGVRVSDTKDLLLEAINAAPDNARRLVEMVASFEKLLPDAEERLKSLSTSELAQVLISGLRADDDEMAPDHIFDLPSIPNLMFARDPQFVIGDSIVFGAMKRDARKRESLISSFIFRNHPEIRTDNILMDGSLKSLTRASNIFGSGTIEGGDVLVMEEGVILVGISERTSEYGIGQLTNALRGHDYFQKLIMVPMPAVRAQMHLDTIFTRLGPDECLIYSPMIADGSAETLSAITIELSNKQDHGKRKTSVLSALRDEGIDLKPIYCGGEQDYIVQAREQWTDGANAFAVGPNMIIMYDRNTATINELDRHDYTIVTPSDILNADKTQLDYQVTPGKKYAFLLPSTELSRARGGPRCMTMPLVRSQS